jgi:hypothetical protein
LLIYSKNGSLHRLYTDGEDVSLFKEGNMKTYWLVESSYYDIKAEQRRADAELPKQFGKLI